MNKPLKIDIRSSVEISVFHSVGKSIAESTYWNIYHHCFDLPDPVWEGIYYSFDCWKEGLR